MSALAVAPVAACDVQPGDILGARTALGTVRYCLVLNVAVRGTETALRGIVADAWPTDSAMVESFTVTYRSRDILGRVEK